MTSPTISSDALAQLNVQASLDGDAAATAADPLAAASPVADAGRWASPTADDDFNHGPFYVNLNAGDIEPLFDALDLPVGGSSENTWHDHLAAAITAFRRGSSTAQTERGIMLAEEAIRQLNAAGREKCRCAPPSHVNDDGELSVGIAACEFCTPPATV